MRIESWGRFSVDVHRVRNSRPSPFSLSYPGQEGALVADFFLKRLSLSQCSRESVGGFPSLLLLLLFMLYATTYLATYTIHTFLHSRSFPIHGVSTSPSSPPLPLLALSKPPSRGTRTQNDVHIRIPRVFLQDGTPEEKKREVAL